MKKLKRTIAAILATVSTTSAMASMAPAFAYDEADALINSYSNPIAQDIAIYCLDNGLTLEETQELVDGYSERHPGGMTRSSNINYYINSNYYHTTRIADRPHFITLIITDTSVNVAGEYAMYLNTAYASSDDTYALCTDYTSVSNVHYSVNTSYGILTNIVVPACPALGTEAALLKYGINVEDGSVSEKNIYDAIYSSDITQDINVAYDIYALGDVQHDGDVDEDDADCLLEYLVSKRADLGFIYYDSNSGEGLHSAITNRLAADANQDGALSINDVIKINRMANGLE